MKLVIIMRNDLNMRKGKMIAQGGHAVQYIMKKYMEASHNVDTPEDLELWRKVGRWIAGDSKKIVLQADNSQIQEILNNCKGIKTTSVVDKGYTDIPENTLTCIALGPDEDESIDKYTRDLKLL